MKNISNKKITKIFLVSFIILLIFSLTGCGSSSKIANNDMGAYQSADGLDVHSMGISSNSIFDNLKGGVETESVSNSSNYIDQNLMDRENAAVNELINEDETLNEVKEEYLERKIVYSGDASLQTKDLDKAREDINSMIEKYEGYIENEEYHNNGDIYGNYNYNSRRMYILIRIPSQHFNEFINNLSSDNIYVNSLNKKSTDLSESYYDKQSRIDSLRIQEERLLDMLKDADTVDVMLQIENRLSDIRYEIESLTKEMKFIDSRVDFSTLSININEVVKYTERDNEPKNFFEELVEVIKESAESFVDWCKDFLFAFIYLLPYLVIIFVIIFFIVKSIKKRRLKKKMLKEKENENK